MALEGVDESARCLHFALHHVLPHEDVALGSGCKEVAVVCEDEHIKNLLINVSKVFVLANQFAIV